MSGGGKEIWKITPILVGPSQENYRKRLGYISSFDNIFFFCIHKVFILKTQLCWQTFFFFFSSNEVINCNVRSLGWWKRVVAECLGNIKPLTRQGEHYKLDLTPLRFLHELLRMWLVNTWDHEMSALFHSLCVIGFFHFPAAGLAVAVISMLSGN